MAEEKGKKKKEPEYIVTYPKRTISEYGYDPSFLRYLASRILIPIILTFIFAIIKGGWIFIIIMWFYVIGTTVYKYYELYPRSRPATEAEIHAYKMLKAKEYIRYKNHYDYLMNDVDEFGNHKEPGEKYGYFTRKKIYPYKK